MMPGARQTPALDWSIIDIAAIKRGASARVRYLPGTHEFLMKLAGNGKRRILVTNAHPTALAI